MGQTVTFSTLYLYQSSGFGDLDFFATIKLLSKNNFNIALQAGIELPTGEIKPSSFDNTTEWLDKLKEEDVVDENSGYYAGFFNICTNLSIKKYSFPVTASLPVISNMNGVQNPPGFRIRLGIVRMF